MSASLGILHITTDGRAAGSSVSIGLLARAQLHAGNRVMVVCPPGYLAERVEAAGVTWRQMDFSSTITMGLTLRRLVDRHDVDVVNAHSSRDRAVCRHLRLTGRLDPALVMTRRAMPRSSFPSAIFSGWAADRVIAVSHAVAEALVRRGTPRSRICVVHNAVDLERLDRVVNEAEMSRARACVGAPSVGAPFMGAPVVGVVSRRKDHGTLLKAMEHVPATLVSLGFEPAPPTSRTLRPPVFLPFQDPRPFYELFDIVVLPTLEEGLSQSLMEAMALGKPVVTTRIRSNEELIEDGVHGLLVPPGDASAMAEAINRLLNDRVLAGRISAAARLRARAAFTIDRTLQLTDAAYRAALLRRAS